jgi:hypothetical protein
VDFNQLYRDHQLLLMRADGAPNEGVRQLHEVAASQVAGRIGCMQRALGASGSHAWAALAASGEASLAPPARHLEGYAS